MFTFSFRYDQFYVLSYSILICPQLIVILNFIVLISALWILRSKDKNDITPDRFLGNIKLINPSKIFTLILTVHFISSFIAVNGEIKYEFSGAKSTAKFLKENNYANYELISSASLATAISGYLDGKEVFIIEENRYGSFRVWDIEPEDYLWPDPNLNNKSDLVQITLDNKNLLNNFLLILEFPLEEKFMNRNRIRKVFEADENVVGKKILLYSLEKNNL